jgi:serine protease Do
VNPLGIRAAFSACAACAGILVGSARAFAFEAVTTPIKVEKPSEALTPASALPEVIFAGLDIGSSAWGRVNATPEVLEEALRTGLTDGGLEIASATASTRLSASLVDLRVQPGKRGLDAEVALAWEAVDSATGTIVYSTITRSSAHAPVFNVDETLARKLVSGAAQRLAGRATFRAILDRPKTVAQDIHVKECHSAPVETEKGLERVLDAAVVVRMSNGIGSGVMVSPDGFVLSAAHVVQGGKPTIVFKSGLTIMASVVRINATQDVALLKVAGSGYPCLQAATTRPAIGATLFAVGAPAGETLAYSVSRGIVSGFRQVDGGTFLQTDASLNPGNSGGPLVDDRGRLLAVVSWKIMGVEGLGFGVPIEAARGSLGLAWADASDAALPAPSTKVDAVRDPEDPPTTFGSSKRTASSRWQAPTGAAALTVGGLGVTFTWLSAVSSTRIPEKQWSNMVYLNDASWALVAGGIGLVTWSLFLPKPSDLRLALGLGGISAEGTFP